MVGKNRLGGQRTDMLEKILAGGGPSSAIPQKTLEHFGNNAKNRTMGVAGSQVEIGPYARNHGPMLNRKWRRGNLAIQRIRRVWRQYRKVVSKWGPVAKRFAGASKLYIIRNF